MEKVECGYQLIACNANDEKGSRKRIFRDDGGGIRKEELCKAMDNKNGWKEADR